LQWQTERKTWSFESGAKESSKSDAKGHAKGSQKKKPKKSGPKKTKERKASNMEKKWEE
jgi:hypothetical protein